MRAKTLALGVLTLGTAAVLISGGILLHAQGRSSVPSFGNPQVGTSSSTRTTTLPSSQPAPSATRAMGEAAPVGREPRAESGPPVEFSLPSLAIRAHIQVVTTDGGALEVPPDPAEVGWWVGSAPVGSSVGTTVLVGHVDSAQLGVGALFRIGRGQLRPGAIITTSTAAGGTFEYRVTAQRSYPKAHGIPAGVFDAGGAPRLALITCGGTFDRTTLSYRDNIVAFAIPA